MLIQVYCVISNLVDIILGMETRIKGIWGQFVFPKLKSTMEEGIELNPKIITYIMNNYTFIIYYI